MLSSFDLRLKFRLPCESGDRALSQGDRTDVRTVRQSRRDFGRATMANQTSTTTIDTTDINLRHEYDDADCLPQPPGATSVSRMGTDCPMTEMQRRARGTTGQLAGPPSVHWQRDRRQQRTKHGTQPPGATPDDDTPPTTGARDGTATRERAHVAKAAIAPSHERQSRSTPARPSTPGRQTAAALHQPPGATRAATGAAVGSEATKEHARLRVRTSRGAELRDTIASDPRSRGQHDGGDAAPTRLGDFLAPGAKCSSMNSSPHTVLTFLRLLPTYQPIVVSLILIAAVAATGSFWERRHFGTSRPHRESYCPWQLEDETSVHSNRRNERLYPQKARNVSLEHSNFGCRQKCAYCVTGALYAIENYDLPKVRTNCNLYTRFNTPLHDATRLPVPYLWHSFATLIIEHRLPWLGHGLANTASPND